MNCLKCGRETQEDRAFCLECEKEMAKHPIDPGVVVHLPPSRQAVSRKPVKRRIPPEEQILQLKKRLRVVFLMFLVTLVTAVCLAVPLMRNLGKTKFQIGQNYNTVKTTTAPTETEDIPQ